MIKNSRQLAVRKFDLIYLDFALRAFKCSMSVWNTLQFTGVQHIYFSHTHALKQLCAHGDHVFFLLFLAKLGDQSHVKPFVMKLEATCNETRQFFLSDRKSFLFSGITINLHLGPVCNLVQLGLDLQQFDESGMTYSLRQKENKQQNLKFGLLQAQNQA